jgi:hypothetical protein
MRATRARFGCCVVFRVDDETLQQGIDALGDFLGERLQLARLDAGRDIVVGAKALPGRLETRTDPVGRSGHERFPARGVFIS